MEKDKDDILGNAMDEFIKEARKAGYNDDTIELIGCALCQDIVADEYGGDSKAFIHFSELVKNGKTEHEILDLAFEKLINPNN